MVKLNAVRLIVNGIPPVGVHKVARVCRESIRFLRDQGFSYVDSRASYQSDMPADEYFSTVHTFNGTPVRGILAEGLAERLGNRGELYLLFTPHQTSVASKNPVTGKYEPNMGYGQNGVAIVTSCCLVSSEVVRLPVHEITHAWLGVDHDDNNCADERCIMGYDDLTEEVFFCDPCKNRALEADRKLLASVS